MGSFPHYFSNVSCHNPDKAFEEDNERKNKFPEVLGRAEHETVDPLLSN